MLRVAATSALGVMQHAAAPSVVIAGTNALLRHGPAWSVQQGLFARFAASNAPTTSAQQATVDTPPKVVPHPSLLSGTAVKAQSSLEGQAVLPIVDPDVAKAMALPVYEMNYLLAVKPYHVPPVTKQQKVAYNVIQTIRRAFDLATGYGPNMTEARWLRRMVFLETVAGVPGMVAGMLRHLRSLRLMRRDNGWINTLLAEAENERMHLLTFMELRNPGPLFRGMVLAAQGVMFNALFCAYLASPKTVHAMVGYLEEEAVRTYTHALQDIDAGKLWPGKPAPAFAKQYWRLAPDATMRDLILVVRADEACHSHVNHTFSKMKGDEPNPFGIGSHQVP